MKIKKLTSGSSDGGWRGGGRHTETGVGELGGGEANIKVRE